MEASEEPSPPERPVGQDAPTGLAEATWWPLIAALGAATLYVGVGLYFLGHGQITLIPAFVGPAVAIAGLGAVAIGLGGWVYQGFVAEYWAFDADSLTAVDHRMGMLLFIVTDLATFGAGFAYYFYFRMLEWPPEHLPKLLSPVLVLNTGVLLASSLTLHLGHRALKRNDRTRFTALVGLTFLLGVAFLAGQAYEYHSFIVEEGFTFTTGSFGGVFYGLTSLHGLHVALGTVLLGIVTARAAVGQYGPDRDTSVETVSMYWHFVDVVWLVLVASLYLSAAIYV